MRNFIENMRRARAAYEALPAPIKKKTPPPPQRRVMLMDVTIEHVQEVMRDSPDGILVFHDELGGWFGSMDKYNAASGASANRAFWLTAFNGKSIHVGAHLAGVRGTSPISARASSAAFSHR